VTKGLRPSDSSRVTNPCSDKLLSRDAVLWKASEFAELVELAASDDVKRVGDGEAVADMFVSDEEFLHMEHVDAEDSKGGLVVEASQ
jgi:hypothetical protein